MPSPKFVVYLAGPITGCNPAQVRHWRDQVKKNYERQCEFLDPVEHLVSDRAIPHEVVAADIDAIENAEGILVNMWRESIRYCYVRCACSQDAVPRGRIGSEPAGEQSTDLLCGWR